MVDKWFVTQAMYDTATVHFLTQIPIFSHI
jgi:hypothetical protein